MWPWYLGAFSSPLNAQMLSIKTPKSSLRRAVLVCLLLSQIVLHGIVTSRSLQILSSQNSWNELSVLSLSGSENIRLDFTMVQRTSACSSSLDLKSCVTLSRLHIAWIHLNQCEQPHKVFRQRCFTVLCKRPLNIGGKIFQRREW